MPSLETRVGRVNYAFGRSIENVLKPVNDQTLTEAFPYATPQMLNALSQQTKTLFTHYANDRWAEFSNRASFEELCCAFDKLEREALDRVNSGAETMVITRDPKLSIPPLLIKTMKDLDNLYSSANESQIQTNERVYAQITKQISEIERLEAGIKTRLGQVKQTLEEWDEALDSGQV